MARAARDSRTASSSVAEASTPQSKSGWQEYQDGWIPLGVAVFRFGIAESDASTTKAPDAGGSLFSIEAYEQSRDGDVGFKVAYEPQPPTLEDLSELLRKHSDASKLEIDREKGRFLFSFTLSGGGAACHGGAPWVILSDPDEPQKLDPRLEALKNAVSVGDCERPFEGFAKIGDDEAAEGARQAEGVRFATGLVWRRFMLPAFDRAVAAGRIKLFARVSSLLDDFQRLPSDIWPLLEVLNWDLGIARDPEGTTYYRIHVAQTVAPPTDKSGGQSFAAADAVLVAEMRSLIEQGNSKSVSDAARQVASMAKGLGSEESKVERLRRAFGRQYPTK